MILTRSKVFLIFCLAFIIGVFLGRFINFEIMAVLAMIFIIVGTIGYKSKGIIIFTIAGVIVIIGALRFSQEFAQNDIKNYYDQTRTIIGIVSDEPDERTDKTYLKLSNISIDGKSYNSKLLLTVARFPSFEYGQQLEFEGKVLEPKEYEDFSYKNYLSRYGIDGVIYYPKILKVEKDQANVVKSKILKFKKKIVQNIAEIMPEPQNSFLGGLLVGLRKTIPSDFTEALSKTGTTHIIAISGYNITIIAVALDSLLLFFFRRRISFVLSLVAIALFVILTGASASAVRAGIMGTLGLIALNTGRVNSINNAIALTAAVMVGLNPQILHFDLGFLLSFAALLGLVYIGPVLREKFSRIPEFINFYLVPSTAAYIATLPILLTNFDQISLIAIPVNVLILFMIPIAMLFGFLLGGVVLVSLTIAQPFVWMTWGALTYVQTIVMLTSKFPGSTISFHISWLWAIMYYLVIIFWLWKRRQNNFSNI